MQTYHNQKTLLFYEDSMKIMALRLPAYFPQDF